MSMTLTLTREQFHLVAELLSGALEDLDLEMIDDDPAAARQVALLRPIVDACDAEMASVAERVA
jgi:hypothetical protein